MFNLYGMSSSMTMMMMKISLSRTTQARDDEETRTCSSRQQAVIRLVVQCEVGAMMLNIESHSRESQWVCRRKCKTGKSALNLWLCSSRRQQHHPTSNNLIFGSNVSSLVPAASEPLITSCDRSSRMVPDRRSSAETDRISATIPIRTRMGLWTDDAGSHLS